MPAALDAVVVVSCAPRSPAAPAPRVRYAAARALPVDADHVEARRRRGRRALRMQRNLAHRQRRPARERDGRRAERREDGEKRASSQDPGCHAPFGAGVGRPSRATLFTTVRAFLAALGLALVLAAGASAAGTGSACLAIKFGPDLEVNPVTQDYLTNRLSKAANDHYDAAVILLDTPGGLSTSMKTIYTAELNAKLPVIVYVSPDGARAASAGVWISEGRGRARDGADDEHRLVDSDRLERRRTSARTCAGK